MRPDLARVIEITERQRRETQAAYDAAKRDRLPLAQRTALRRALRHLQKTLAGYNKAALRPQFPTHYDKA